MPNLPAEPSRSRLFPELLCLTLLYLYDAWFSRPFFFDALTNSSREIATYNPDSLNMLVAVNRALSAPLFRVDFFDYGHIYFNIAIALSYVYSLFAPLDDWTTFFILRLVSWLGTALTLTLIFVFARRFLGRIESVSAACLFAFSPAAIQWGIEVHPDSWQMFFLTLSIYYCARSVAAPHPSSEPGVAPASSPPFKFVVAAAAAAGAAFGTKYLGVLMVPLIVVATFVAPVDGRTDRAYARAGFAIGALALLLAPLAGFIGYELRPGQLLDLFPTWSILKPESIERLALLARAACLLGAGFAALLFASWVLTIRWPAGRRLTFIPAVRLLIVGAVFVGVFAVASPWSVYQLQFVPNVMMQSVRTGLGETFGLRWLPYVFGTPGYDGDLVGWETSALALVGAAVLGGALLRRDLRGARAPFLFVLGFLAIFLAFLVSHVNRVTLGYALPAVPPLVPLAAFALSEVRPLVTRWTGPRAAFAATAAIAAMVAGTQILHGTKTLDAYRTDNLIEALAPDNKMLGDWLNRCVSRDAKIIAAAYSYVPPQFDRLLIAASLRQLTQFKPDLVILGKEDMAFFRREASTLAADPYTGDLNDILSFFDDVTQSSQWQAGPDFTRFQIYLPSSPTAAVRTSCL